MSKKKTKKKAAKKTAEKTATPTEIERQLAAEVDAFRADRRAELKKKHGWTAADEEAYQLEQFG